MKNYFKIALLALAASANLFAHKEYEVTNPIYQANGDEKNYRFTLEINQDNCDKECSPGRAFPDALESQTVQYTICLKKAPDNKTQLSVSMTAISKEKTKKAYVDIQKMSLLPPGIPFYNLPEQHGNLTPLKISITTVDNVPARQVFYLASDAGKPLMLQLINPKYAHLFDFRLTTPKS